MEVENLPDIGTSDPGTAAAVEESPSTDPMSSLGDILAPAPEASDAQDAEPAKTTDAPKGDEQGEGVDEDVMKALSGEPEIPAGDTPADGADNNTGPSADELAEFRAWKATQSSGQAAIPPASAPPAPTEPVPLDITQEDYDNAVLGENGLESFRGLLGKAAAVGGANAIMAAREEIAKAVEQVQMTIEQAKLDQSLTTARQLDWALSFHQQRTLHPEIRGNEKAFAVAYNKELAKPDTDYESAAEAAAKVFKTANAAYRNIQKSGKRVDMRGPQAHGSSPAPGARLEPAVTEPNDQLGVILAALNGLGGKS